MNHTSRRQFLQIGLAATAWPMVAPAAQAAGLDRRPGLPLLGVVYDTRFAESLAFARRSEALGVRVHGIDGDMTRVWYDDIYHRWKQGPTALAGLTAHGPMFCFAELARDVGMRLIFRAEHRPAGDGAIAHAFTGPSPMLAAAIGACDRGDAPWSAMADVVVGCPSGRVEIASAARTAPRPPAAPGRTTLNTATLYTWVIAPVVRA